MIQLLCRFVSLSIAGIFLFNAYFNFTKGHPEYYLWQSLRTAGLIQIMCAIIFFVLAITPLKYYLKLGEIK